MSLMQIHQSACAICRLRSIVAAKRFARSRVPLPSIWRGLPHYQAVRRLHSSGSARPNETASDDLVRGRDEQVRPSLDSEAQADHQVVRRAEEDFELDAAMHHHHTLPETQTADEFGSLDVQSSASPPAPAPAPAKLTPEQAATQARQRYGDALPEDHLDDEEYKAYERMYGAPIRVFKAGEEEIVDFEEGEVQEELDESVNVGTGVLKEGKDGQLEEVQYIEEELDVDEELEAEAEAEEEEEGMLDGSEETTGHGLRSGFKELDEQTLADLAALRMQDGEEMDPEFEHEGFMRTHPLTAMNRFSTPSSTVHLPKSSFVDPVSMLVSRLPHKHISETAHRVFGGPGLPYSTSTPRRALTMPQKAIPLDPYQGKMSEMDADIYAATIMPGVYASTYSIMVETRKRLGSSWLQGLLTKEGGPRILDAGGAGSAVIAVREILKAEWQRMHDTSDDPDAVTDVAEAGGQTGGEAIPVPVGRASVLTASDALRVRASALLDNTTFLPRLPDYVHASDESAKERGKFDIIVAPHTLWQIKEEHLRKQHISNLWSLLSTDGGVLILLEKGIPRGFEMVAAAREMLLNTRISSPGEEEIAEDITAPEGGTQWGKKPKGTGMIIAPCTNHSECPMYSKGSGTSKGRKDYCHFSQRYIRPPFLQKLLGAKDRNHEDVQFSYVSVMRGRDLRDHQADGIVQGERATAAAFAGYENPDAPAAAAAREPTFEHEVDPTAPAIPDVDAVYATTTDANGVPHSLGLPRTILPPLKRHGHVLMDVCTPSGTLERWTVPRSFSRQAYRDARKAAWGDLWALGAKTRTVRNVRVGRKEELAGVHTKGAITVKGKSRKFKVGGDGEDQRNTQAKKGGSRGGPKNVIEVGYDSRGNIKEEDIKVRNGGRMRQGKVSGIRDKRDKKGLGNGRRKGVEEEF